MELVKPAAPPEPHVHLATDKIGLALAAIEFTKDHNVLEDLPTR